MRGQSAASRSGAGAGFRYVTVQFLLRYSHRPPSTSPPCRASRTSVSCRASPRPTRNFSSLTAQPSSRVRTDAPHPLKQRIHSNNASTQTTHPLKQHIHSNNASTQTTHPLKQHIHGHDIECQSTEPHKLAFDHRCYLLSLVPGQHVGVERARPRARSLRLAQVPLDKTNAAPICMHKHLLIYPSDRKRIVFKVYAGEKIPIAGFKVDSRVSYR